MARERQQYSGDGAHQLLAVRCAFGERRLSARFLRTFSEGMTPEGYFLDCLAGLRPAGAGDAADDRRHLLGPVAGPRRRLQLRLLEALPGNGRPGGHRRAVSAARAVRRVPRVDPRQGRAAAGRKSRHPAGLDRPHRLPAAAAQAVRVQSLRGGDVRARPGAAGPGTRRPRSGPTSSPAAGGTFWRPRCGSSGARSAACSSTTCPGSPRRRARGYATARWPRRVLFDQCPGGNTAASLRRWSNVRRKWASPIRATPAGAMGLGAARPGRRGRSAISARRWAKMKSVVLNNTLQEDWDDATDSPDEWSHCCVSPIYVFFSDVAGIRPTAPGFARCQVRPQLADLPDLEADLSHGPRPDPFRGRAPPGRPPRRRLDPGRLRGGTALAARRRDRPAAAYARSSARPEAVPAGVGQWNNEFIAR